MDIFDRQQKHAISVMHVMISMCWASLQNQSSGSSDQFYKVHHQWSIRDQESNLLSFTSSTFFVVAWIFVVCFNFEVQAGLELNNRFRF